MHNWNDFQNNGQTIYLFFPTLIGQDAEAVAGAGSPAVELYKDGSDTPITTGQTLSLVNSNAGAYKLAIEFGEAYGDGEYGVYWSAGTADSVSLVDRLIGTFSIGRNAAAEEVFDAPITLAAGALSATPTAAEILGLIALLLRNKKVTSTPDEEVRVYADDDTTVVFTQALTDSAGVFTQGKQT